MNELNINYSGYKKLPTRRRRIQRLVGVLFFGFGIFYLIFLKEGDRSLAFTISALCNALLGILIFSQTYPLNILYPKHFIRITNEIVSYKISHLSKEVRIEWDRVNSLAKDSAAIHFILEDGRRVKLKTKWLPVTDVKRIVSKLETLAQAKSIELTGK